MIKKVFIFIAAWHVLLATLTLPMDDAALLDTRSDAFDAQKSSFTPRSELNINKEQEENFRRSVSSQGLSSEDERSLRRSSSSISRSITPEEEESPKMMAARVLYEENQPPRVATIARNIVRAPADTRLNRVPRLPRASYALHEISQPEIPDSVHGYDEFALKKLQAALNTDIVQLNLKLQDVKSRIALNPQLVRQVRARTNEIDFNYQALKTAKTGDTGDLINNIYKNAQEAYQLFEQLMPELDRSDLQEAIDQLSPLARIGNRIIDWKNSLRFTSPIIH